MFIPDAGVLLEEAVFKLLWQFCNLAVRLLLALIFIPTTQKIINKCYSCIKKKSVTNITKNIFEDPYNPCCLTLHLICQFRGLPIQQQIRYDVKNMDKWGYNYLI